MAAIVAFQSPWPKKIIGILMGVGMMFLFNLVRISLLLWLDVHHTDWFDTFHHTILPFWLMVNRGALLLLVGRIGRFVSGMIKRALLFLVRRLFSQFRLNELIAMTLSHTIEILIILSCLIFSSY